MQATPIQRPAVSVQVATDRIVSGLQRFASEIDLAGKRVVEGAERRSPSLMADGPLRASEVAGGLETMDQLLGAELGPVRQTLAKAQFWSAGVAHDAAVAAHLLSSGRLDEARSAAATIVDDASHAHALLLHAITELGGSTPSG